MIVGMQLTARDEYYDVKDKSQVLDFEFQGKSYVSKCGYKHCGDDFDVETMLFQNKKDDGDYYLKLNYFKDGKIIYEQEMAFYSEKEIKDSKELEIVLLNILNNMNKQSSNDFYNK